LDVAVLILTYDRVTLLQKCVESILNQKQHDLNLKLYILINGEDQDALDYTKTLKEKINIQVIYKEKSLPVGEARNKLIEEIKEEWICFLDDDIYLSPTYFSDAYKFMQEYKEIEIFGGPDTNTDTANDFQETLSFVMENFFATGPTNKRHKSFGNSIIDGNEVNLILCNFWAKRSVFDIKLFPEKFRRNEENYLLAILKDKGIRMKYVPYLIVHHNRKVDYKKIIRVLYLAGIYRVVSMVFYPKSIHIIFFLHLAFLALLVSLFIYNLMVGTAFFSAYFFIIFIQSLMVAFKQKKILGLPRAIFLFLIFNFVYPVGQLHGVFKSLRYKIMGQVF
jgi:GT2 family glycosyltransferase